MTDEQDNFTKWCNWVGPRLNFIELVLFAIFAIGFTAANLLNTNDLQPFLSIPFALYMVLYFSASYYSENLVENAVMGYFYHKLSYLSLAIASLGLFFLLNNSSKTGMLLVMGGLSCVFLFFRYVVQLGKSKHSDYRLLLRLGVFGLTTLVSAYYWF